MSSLLAPFTRGHGSERFMHICHHSTPAMKNVFLPLANRQKRPEKHQYEKGSESSHDGVRPVICHLLIHHQQGSNHEQGDAHEESGCSRVTKSRERGVLLASPSTEKLCIVSSRGSIASSAKVQACNKNDHQT